MAFGTYTGHGWPKQRPMPANMGVSGVIPSAANPPAATSYPAGLSSSGTGKSPYGVSWGANGTNQSSNQPATSASSSPNPSASTSVMSAPDTPIPVASNPAPAPSSNPTSGGGAGISSSGSGPTPYGMAFDDGGSIPDPGGVIPSDPQDPSEMQDTSQGGSQSGSPDLSSALQSVKSALAFGRKQSGMPAVLTGGVSSTPSVTPNSAQSFDDGGAVDDSDTPDNSGGDDNSGGVIPQPGTSQGAAPQQPSKMAGYLTGAGAVTPDIASALEGRVDPQGKMDPSARKMMAIASAGDPSKQFALMQHYRQKFNAYNGFARVAADGTPQKPADMNAAAHAATQAYQNVPDGTSVMFQPTQGGVVAHVKQLAQPKQPQQAQQSQSFDDGGDVQDEQAIGDPGGAMGTGPEGNNPIPAGPAVSSPDQAIDANAIAGTPGAEPTSASLPSSAQPYQPSAGTTPYTLARDAVTGIGNAAASLFSKKEDSAPTSIPMTAQQFQQFLKGAQYDGVMDQGLPGSITQYVRNFNNPGQGGGGASPAPAGEQTPRLVSQGPGLPVVDNSKAGKPVKSALDPDDVAQANALFPMASQSAQRSKFLEAQMNQRQTKGASEDLQRLKNEGLQSMWTGRNAAGVERAQIGANAKTGAATITQGGINGRNAQTVVGRMIDSAIAQGVRAPDIMANIPKYAAIAGITPEQFKQQMVEHVTQMQQSQQGGGQATGQPQGQQAQPQQTDISYLLANPGVAQKFNARFGNGAAERYLGR